MFPAGNRRDGSRWARGGAGPGTGTRAVGPGGGGGGGLRPGHGYPGASQGRYQVAGGGPFAACPAAPMMGCGWKVIPRT
jgi:hypothetical protein